MQTCNRITFHAGGWIISINNCHFKTKFKKTKKTAKTQHV